MEAGLQYLLDVEEIRNVHRRYCRGIDRFDWELVRSCYHPDAIDDHGLFKGDRDSFIRWASEFLAGFESTTHFIGNQLVEINGDSAWTECYCRAYHRRKATATAPAADWMVNLRYVDRLERRDGAWKIAKRLIVCESQRTDPISSDQELGPELHKGTRGKSDPSYSR